MNQKSKTTSYYDNNYAARSISEQGIDIHVYVVPLLLWRDHLRSADSQAVITDAISAGFIRIMPDAIVNSLRIDIENQLDFETVPRNFVFLKCVGRCFTVIKAKQEYSLKAKNFTPPQTFAPEIYLMELTADIRSILTSSQSSQSSQLQDHRDHHKHNSHVTYPHLKPNKSQSTIPPHMNDSRLSFAEDEEDEDDSGEDEERENPVLLKRQVTATKSLAKQTGDYVLTPNSKYTQTMAEKDAEEEEEEDAKNRIRSKREEESARRKDMLRRLALDQQREEQRKREETARKEAEAMQEDEWRKKQEEELRKRLEEEQRRKQEEERRKRLEEEGQRQLEERKKQAEELRKQFEEQRKRKEEELRTKQQEELEKKFESQRKRIAEDELKRKQDEERRRQEQEQKKKQEEEENRETEKERKRISEEQQKASERNALLKEIERLREERKVRELKKDDLTKKVKSFQERSQLNRNNIRDNWRKKYLEEKKKMPALERDCNRLKKELDAINKKILSNVESTSRIITHGLNQKPSEKSNLRIQAIRLRMEIEDLKGRLDNLNMRVTTELKLRTQAEQELQLLRNQPRPKVQTHSVKQDKKKPNAARGKQGAAAIGGKADGSQGKLTSQRRLPPVA